MSNTIVSSFLDHFRCHPKRSANHGVSLCVRALQEHETQCDLLLFLQNYILLSVLQLHQNLQALQQPSESKGLLPALISR